MYTSMHKQLAVVFLGLITFTGCVPTRDDYRKDYVKGCVNRYAKDSTVASTEGRKIVEEYCNCLGDKLNLRMDAEQWRNFNKSGDTSLAHFYPYIESCIDNFQKNKVRLPQ